MRRRVSIVLSVAVAALVFTAAAWALRFTDESYFTPVGAVGSPYSFAFGGAGGCGPALPYQYNLLAGSLPPGLTLAKSGQISGTPTQAGSWSFWVNLSDQNPPSADWCRPSEAQREFSITINGSGGGSPPPAPAPGQSISITTGSLPEASAGSPYSLTFAASGSATKSWTITTGSLPAGLSLGSNGVLSGTPTSAGNATFTVKVSAGEATS
jgi:large repetitive protein